MRRIDDEKLTELLKQGKSYREIGEEFGVSAPAICKRVKRLGLLNMPESMGSLTDKEKQFCLAVSSGQSRISAAMQAYDVASRESAKALQNTLMKNPEIQTAIADLMERYGLSRSYRLKKLKQHVDNRDPLISLRALDQSWRLDGYQASSEANVNITIKTISASAYYNGDDAIDINQSENHDPSRKPFSDISIEVSGSPYPHRSED